MTPSLAVRNSTTMKPFARRSSATGSATIKFPRRSSFGSNGVANIFSGGDVTLEIRKAREQIIGCRALTSEARVRRCQSLVTEALGVMQDEETGSFAAAVPQDTTALVPSSVDLGYGEEEPAETSVSTTENAESLGYGCKQPENYFSATVRKNHKRRYQRRCSVTEFSLKAAVLAKVQLERQNHRRSSN